MDVPLFVHGFSFRDITDIMLLYLAKLIAYSSYNEFEIGLMYSIASSPSLKIANVPILPLSACPFNQ